MQNSKTILLKALLFAGIFGLILLLDSINIIVKTLLLAGSFGLAGVRFLAMGLAPSGFTYWWWD